MSPEELLLAQAEMRRRARERHKRRKTLVKRRYRKHNKPEPPPVDLSSFPTKTVGGVTVIICPPSYNKALEFDRSPHHYNTGGYVPVDDYDVEESRWQPPRSVYKALCKAANAGSYLVLDTDQPYDSQQTGMQLARALVSTLQRCIRKNRLLPLAWQELLGCDLEYFQGYIDKLFKPGMNWNNWGEWHLDHVKPLVSFSLDFRPELLSACNYRNLQPLWAPENCSKGGRIDG